MITKKAVIPLLLVLSVLIWSHNIYRVINSVFKAEEEIIVKNEYKEKTDTDYLLTFNSEPRNKFVYKSEFRDPFKDWLHIRNKRKEKEEAMKVDIPIKTISLPKLRFTGLLKDDSGNLAVIEDLKGKIHFVDVNDRVAEVTITRISDHFVECTYRGKEFKLELSR